MPKDFLPRYMEIAESVAELIASGSLRPGDPIPSIRNASARHRVSKGTIRQAYGVLESRGMIEARPQSGFYVRARTVSPTELPRTALTRPRLVEIKRSRRVEAILSGQVGSPVISLGSSFPDQSLFPVQSLGRSMAACVRSSAHVDTIEDLQLGLPALRRAISQRYLELGYSVSADEILITCGGMEAISLSLQAVTQPNDMIVIDSPMFFSGLPFASPFETSPHRDAGGSK